MSLELGWNVPTKWVAALLVLFLGWQAVMFTFFRPREYSEKEKVAIERVCREAADRTGRAVNEHEHPSIGLTHLLDDPSNHFTAMLGTNLAERSELSFVDGSVAQNFFRQVMEALENATSLEEIVFAANNVELDLVACGKVIEVREEDRIGYATLHYLVYDIPRAEWVINEMISADSRLDPGAWLKESWKLWVALLIIGLLPWLCFRLLERVVERNSNAASGALIAGLMALNVLLLWWGGLFGAKVAVPTIGILVALFYNLWACDFISKRVE